jgi:hypothetical protein
VPPDVAEASLLAQGIELVDEYDAGSKILFSINDLYRSFLRPGRIK